MGSSQSTRKLTVNNEDGVIQISTDLVQRLTQNSHNSQEQRTGGSDVNSDKKPVDNHIPTSEVTSQPSSLNSYPEYTITAYKIQQQKELELQAQELYWQKRVHSLKLANEKINKVFQDEYKRAKDEIASAEGHKKINLDSMIPPCSSNKERVLKCYQSNPKEILKCSREVEEFTSCVDHHRAQIIAARC